jgi:hypothetical protein
LKIEGLELSVDIIFEELLCGRSLVLILRGLCKKHELHLHVNAL